MSKATDRRDPSGIVLVKGGLLSWFVVAVWLGLGIAGQAQITLNEGFTGTTAPGWSFIATNGSTAPYLTANTVDSPGTGWLRLTENQQNQTTMAYYTTPFAAAGTQITVSFDFTLWNQNALYGAANGFTFFLADGSVSSPQPGAGNFSLGYAQLTSPSNVNGLTGGWLGVGIDVQGAFSSSSYGHSGGGATSPNSVALRGAGTNLTGYPFLGGSGSLTAVNQNLNFPNNTTRPDQTGSDYRQATITIDTNNAVTVSMVFGAGNASTVVVSSTNLVGQARPSTLIFGFTGATGLGSEVTEIRSFGIVASVPTALVPELSSGLIVVLALVIVAGVQGLLRRRRLIASRRSDSLQLVALPNPQPGR